MAKPLRVVRSRNLRMASCGLALMLSGAVSPYSASALESAALGDTHGTQSAVSSVEMKVDVLAAMVSNSLALISDTLNRHAVCNKSRKFYAPSDTRKDASGCVGVQDYDYAAANNSSISGYGVYGLGASGIGVHGESSGSYGVYGTAKNTWAGFFDGSPGGYGTYGQGIYGVYGNSIGAGGVGVFGTTSTNSSWAGIFNAAASPNGLNIYNNANNAQLCLNGSCTTNLSAVAPPIQFGGIYMLTNGACANSNPATGGCSCPAGYSARGGRTGRDFISYAWDKWYDMYYCYK